MSGIIGIFFKGHEPQVTNTPIIKIINKNIIKTQYIITINTPHNLIIHTLLYGAQHTGIIK